MVKLELTDEDAFLFQKFRQHQDAFNRITMSRVFDIRGGSAVIHFDHDGNIMRIDRNDRIFDLTKR